MNDHRTTFGFWIAGVLTAAAMGGLALAQTGSAPAGKPDEMATASFTAAQAASGRSEYAARCIDCHGAALNDGEFGGPPLKGEAFRAKWFDQPAVGLVGYVSAAMPPDAPGRLPLGTYAEIVAYLLSANGVAPGDRELPADLDALASLRLTLGSARPQAAR